MSSDRSEAPRILIDLMPNGTQFEFRPEHLGLPEGDPITAQAVIEALKQSGGKYENARDLGLLDESTWSLYVQVIGNGNPSRAEW